MANRDYLFRAKADTSNYDANLAKARQTLNSFQQANYSAGGVIKQMTSQLTVSAAKFASFGAAVSAAMKVARDAFMSSESNADQWASTIAAAGSVYQSFVQSLNNASFSGFLSNIDKVVEAARNAYNAMDELGTRMTVINPERARLQARATELRATIRREGADSEAGRAAQAALRALEPTLQKSFKTESQLNMSAFEAAVDKKLAEGGITLDKDSRAFLMRTFSSDEAFNRLRAGARGGITAGTTISGTTSMTFGSRDTRNTNAKLMDLFTDEWRSQYAPLLSAAYGARSAAASAMLGNARYLREGGGRSGGGGRGGGGSVTYVDEGIKGVANFGVEAVRTSSSIKELRDQLSQYQAALMGATNAADYRAASAGISSTSQKLAWAGGAMALGVDVDDLVTQINDALDAARGQIKPLNIVAVPADEMQRHAAAVAKDGQDTQAAWQAAAAAINSAGNALSSLDNPSAKIAGLIGQAVANIALGFAQASASPATGAAGVFGWIAAATAGLATMTATISQIKSVTAGYADGGIVKGNTYSGDQIYGGAFVNAGELVLNKAQQSTLASVLQGGGGQGNSSSHPYVSGEQIFLGLNNFLRRSGRGELITSR